MKRSCFKMALRSDENHITTRLTESLCITGGTLLIIEQTGEKSRITLKFHKNLYLKSCREVLQWMHLVLTGL